MLQCVFKQVTFLCEDIDTIEDPMRRNAVISFIHNFGQMPKQLFKRAHRPRKVFTGTATTTGSPLTEPGSVMPQVFFKNLAQLLPSKEPVKGTTCYPITCLLC